jgi:hypothetical protein
VHHSDAAQKSKESGKNNPRGGKGGVGGKGGGGGGYKYACVSVDPLITTMTATTETAIMSR